LLLTSRRRVGYSQTTGSLCKRRYVLVPMSPCFHLSCPACAVSPLNCCLHSCLQDSILLGGETIYTVARQLKCQRGNFQKCCFASEIHDSGAAECFDRSSCCSYFCYFQNRTKTTKFESYSSWCLYTACTRGPLVVIDLLLGTKPLKWGDMTTKWTRGRWR
jgi:hypothetical protein